MDGLLERNVFAGAVTEAEILAVPTGDSLLSFWEEQTWSMTFPFLFVYGVGQPQSRRRVNPMNLEQFCHHICYHHDPRFRRHRTFIFSLFSLRRVSDAVQQSRLRMQRGAGLRGVQSLNSITVQQLRSVIKQMVNANAKSAPFPELPNEWKKLLRQIRAVEGKLPDSTYASRDRRWEGRSLMVNDGSPTLWVPFSF
jgi:hypothetical protein